MYLQEIPGQQVGIDAVKASEWQYLVTMDELRATQPQRADCPWQHHE